MQVLGGGMYETFYGLREKPFNLTPDPRFLYLSEMHKEAFAHLIFGIRNRVGFIMVTGEIGTGKTTICRSLLGQLDQDVELAFIFNPCLSPEELLRKINEDFGIRSRAISVKGLIDELNTYLLDRHSKNKNCVLVIDEAQNLTPPVLEQIRLLSNLETERQKLLQIVLIGQPELAEHLELPELRQLNQRITARYHLKPLGEKETMQYIAYRLRIAGGMRKIRFTRSAIKGVYRHSKGTPRVINAICDRALLIGYGKETCDITRSIVKQAAREIRGERVRSKKKLSFLSRYVPGPRLAAAAVLIVLVGIFIVRPVAGRLDSLVALLNRPPAPSPAETLPVDTSTPAPGPSEVPAPGIAEPAPVAIEEEPEKPAPSAPSGAGEEPDRPAALEETPPGPETVVVKAETPEPASVSPPEAAPSPEAPAPSPEPAEKPEVETPEPAPVPEPVEKPEVEAPEPAPVPEAVKEAVAETPEPAVAEPAAPEPEKPARQPGVFDAIALVAAVVPQDSPRAETPPTAESVAEKGDAQLFPADAPMLEGFAGELEALEPGETLKAAASSLLEAWNMALLADAPAGDDVRHLAQFASAYGLTAEPLSASLAELEALNLPAFVRMGAGDKSLWMALLSTKKDAVRCSTRLGKTVTVPREEFAKAYRTEAVVLWRDPAPGADVLRPNMEGDQVRALQHRLRQLGRYQGELTGVYDTATTIAVTAIQAETALKRDGKAGSQVRMVLCSWLSDFPTPGLHATKAVQPVQTAGETGSAENLPVAEEKPSMPREAPSAPAAIARVEEPEPAPRPAPVPAPRPELPKTQDSGTTETEPETPDRAPAAAPPEAPANAPEGVVTETPTKGPGETVVVPEPLVTVVELPKEPEAAPPPPGRDVEALLAEEVYGGNTRESGKEITSPVFTGAPLVPHRGENTEPADGENG